MSALQIESAALNVLCTFHAIVLRQAWLFKVNRLSFQRRPILESKRPLMCASPRQGKPYFRIQIYKLDLVQIFRSHLI